jgi:serine/threonine protein kinase
MNDHLHPSVPDESAAEDPRLLEAVREYQAALETGRRPNKREFLARYPEIADELAGCLDGLDFLRSAAPRMRGLETAAPPETPPVEGTIGDFRIIREIGRGGMGIVYEAEQISLFRRVALKVLPFAATLDARQLQRFENEARAAAQLHHGNIVPVFAVGCERGVHYYAMQLIDGRPLSAVIAHCKEDKVTRWQGDKVTKEEGSAAAVTLSPCHLVTLASSSVAGKPFFRGVASLGVQAAEALEYAHQMGVVHRDVKPANLILDGRGTLWVTDFGLARFQSCPGMTSPGDLVGTLRYMSPEQAAGAPVIDPRSDVYSLGATLYELLLQQPAFPGSDKHACLRQILEQDPIPPRRLNKSVPVELETIVLKSMAKNPDERYCSARELADDLKRFLDDQPVQARRPGIRERLSKWAWRRRQLVGAAMMGQIAAGVVLAVTTWQISLAESRVRAANEDLKEQEQRTAEALKLEAAQRQRVESNYRQARKVLDFLTQVGVEEMAGKPRLPALRRRLLTELLAYYNEFIDQHADDPQVTAELIETRLQVAGLLDELGKRAESLDAFEKALRDRGRMPGEHRPPFPGQFGLPRGLARPFLVSLSSVREELKLSPEQVQQLAPLVNFRRKPPAETDLAAAERKLAEVLTAQQDERLRQIARQMRGVPALLDPETSETLGLTDKQFESIQALLAKAHARRRRGPGKPGNGPPPHPRSRRPEMDRKQFQEQVLAVLTPEQRDTWQQMLGEPFKGEIRFGPPARGNR